MILILHDRLMLRAVVPNLLVRQFNPERPTRAWASDITCIATGGSWLYLARVMDLHSRRVIGWNMSKRMTRHLVMDAMEMAIGQRRPAKQSGFIFTATEAASIAAETSRNCCKGTASAAP